MRESIFVLLLLAIGIILISKLYRGLYPSKDIIDQLSAKYRLKEIIFPYRAMTYEQIATSAGQSGEELYFSPGGQSYEIHHSILWKDDCHSSIRVEGTITGPRKWWWLRPSWHIFFNINKNSQICDSNIGRGHDSGVVALKNGRLQYFGNTGLELTLQLSDVKVIGEKTNENGPFCEDYFLVLVQNNGKWHEIPLSAFSWESVLEKMERDTGSQLQLQLINSTTFASRVLWPTKLAGKPIFDFVQTPLPNWLRFANRFGLASSSLTNVLSKEIEDWLEKKLSQ